MAVVLLEPTLAVRARSKERAVHLEGGLFGPDFLEQLQAGNPPGQQPADFGMTRRRSVLEEAAEAYRDAQDLWKVFRRRLDRLPEDDPATSLTREGWMIPLLGLLGYELSYNPRAYEVDGVSYAVSHRAGQHEDAPPVHIVGARRELGRVDPSGRPRLSPHALLQEFLNRSEHLWGIVTNGRVLRLLRKSSLLRRQAYVEFDLEAIFDAEDGARFSDFLLLYRLLHRTRLPKGVADAGQCWLERYHQDAQEQGNRARERLRGGVEECLRILGTGFLRHSPEWKTLYAEADHSVAVRLYADLLRLVYRFLFLLVAEERGLLGGSELYREHYSVTRLRRLADRLEAYTDHDDLWQSLRILWHLLRDPTPQVDGKPLATLLDLPVLDGGLFEPIDLENLTISNRNLLQAFYHLAYYYDEEARTYRRVNYAALDVEELGSVYESLLDNHPVIEEVPDGPEFTFTTGTERKSTGSYYTPPELVAELVRSALEPLLEERLAWAKRMAEDLKRVASGEWRVVYRRIQELGGDAYAHSVLSRLGSLAKRDGLGRTDLSPDPRVSEGGTVRLDESDASGGSLGASEYRRGVGAPGNEGISSVSEHLSGQPAGAGDVLDTGRAHSAHLDAGPAIGAGIDSRAQPSTPEPTTQSQAELAAIWSRLPLATRHSLLARGFAEQAILSLKVLDPATGSGHFLLAAARRLGKELARLRTGEDEPSPEALREATRDVIAHCIYGVDKNPLAVELCKVALWIESQVPGKPLTFLDHHIRVGDSLVGVLDLAVLKEGIPDAAYDPVEGDDRTYARALRKHNAQDRTGHGDLFGGSLEDALRQPAAAAMELERIPDDSPKAVMEKARRHRGLQESLNPLRQAANLWTAAFFQKMQRGNPPITTEAVRRALARQPVHGQVAALAEALAHTHRFFHWPLEFPEVFGKAASSEQRVASSDAPLATRHSPLADSGGFDVVLGNPPWERIKLQEQEFFAARDPQIANAPNAAKRKQLIAGLKQKNPALWQAYLQALHTADSTSRFLRGSRFYPLTGRGDINTYSVFAERMRALLKPGGRMGIIVPTGIATDDTNKHFFAQVAEHGELVSLYDFENRKGLFPEVHRSYKFSLFTLTRSKQATASREWRVASGGDDSLLATRHSRLAEFAFFLHDATDLQDPERRFTLAPEDFRLVNPNTRTAPIFRSRRDAELTKHIYRRVPVLINETKGDAGNPWEVSFLAMFHMANDSHLFRTRKELEDQGFRLRGNLFVKGKERYLPLYEAKMVHHFDHRFGDYSMQPEGSESTHLPEVPLERLADPHYQVLPRYWVPEAEVEARLAAKGWDRGWLLGWRRITNVTNERTVVAFVIPRVGSGDNIFLLLSPNHHVWALSGVFSGFAFDYCARQKMGGTNMNFFIFEQLPVLPPSALEKPLPFPTETAGSERGAASGRKNSRLTTRYSPLAPTVADFIRPRVLELTYTAWDLKPFAEDLGYDGPPFRYDPERRFWLRAELDALFFLLYLGTPKEWEEEASPELKALFPTPRDAVAYILEQFPIVRRKDEERFGEYRTQRVILEIYDAMLKARHTGKLWVSKLNLGSNDEL